MQSTNTITRLGLRVDVDTFRGTRDGVVPLLNLFSERNIKASFFFSVGPDNMGRHLWRLLKPAFLLKMLRSKSASLYGWDILFKGTFWPGPNIAEHQADIFRKTAEAGHEIGLHAWDHHYWQAKAEHMSRAEICYQLELGLQTLSQALDQPVSCSAVAGWKCTDKVLLEKDKYPFRYNSDCRGTSVFTPYVDDQVCTPQIPVTLPTYDEVIGRDGINDANYNDALISQIKPASLNVLTIHAEVEGIARHELFNNFLDASLKRNIRCVPLGKLLPANKTDIPKGKIKLKAVNGREGTVSWQSTELSQ